MSIPVKDDVGKFLAGNDFIYSVFFKFLIFQQEIFDNFSGEKLVNFKKVNFALGCTFSLICLTAKCDLKTASTTNI